MMWQTWINIVLGVAVVAVAFVNLSGTALVWTLSVIGVVIVLVELWEANTIAELSSKKHSQTN